MNQINDKPFRIFIPLIISVLELDNAINVMMIICFVIGDASMAYICIHRKKRMRTRIINDSSGVCAGSVYLSGFIKKQPLMAAFKGKGVKPGTICLIGGHTQSLDVCLTCAVML